MKGKHIHVWRIFYSMLGRVGTPNYHSEMLWVTAHASAVRLCEDLCDCERTRAVSWAGDAFEADRGHGGISVRSVDTPPYKQTENTQV